MNITIVGSGNIGTQFAVHVAEKGHQVKIFSSKPDKIFKHLSIVNEKNDVIHAGDIKEATNDPKIAFEEADVIFITMPAYCMREMADKIYPYAKKEMKIGIIPGTGGGECAFKDCADKGVTIFGLQRVPSVARLVEYGKIVRATGYREELFVGSIPSSQVCACAKIISDIFDIPCRELPNYLNLTLTPSNPILHTARLKSLFGDYRRGVIYDRVPLFYEDWDDAASELLLACDDEVQKICRKLNQFDLSFVKSLKIHYESFTVAEMTKKISGIEGFKGLASPVKKVEGGYVPDMDSRYFTADFPYGLKILVQIADFLNLDVPNMKGTLKWYYDTIIQKNEFRFSDYGIYDLQQFIDFYSR